MLPKRMLLGALLLTALVIMAGCATTGESDDDYARQYRNASEDCIRFGYVRDSYAFNRCVEKRLKSGKKLPLFPRRYPSDGLPHRRHL